MSKKELLNKEWLLECRNISKSFGGTQALSNVMLKVHKGEVHALLGENGAGKSTLMKIIIGMIRQNSGDILFDGKPYSANGPLEAAKAGISMIHQELNTEPYLTVAENIFLHREDVYKGGFFLNKKETNRKAQEILSRYGLNISPNTPMQELTLAQAQMIEIIKAVSFDSKLVIMDEPTSSLDKEETERLFATIAKLKQNGVTVIYISHRMEEIHQVCDSFTVYRDGKYIGSGSLNDYSDDELIKMMVGRELKNLYSKQECKLGDVAFRAIDLSGKGFSNISFEVHHGEILGISGLVGAGRSETMRAIFGLDKLSSGEMYLDGKKLTIKSPKDAISNGIAMINEDRKNYGLCLYRSIKENISLPALRSRQRSLLINKHKEEDNCNSMTGKLRIKTSNISNEAHSLSGGNQQKVVIAKWLLTNPRLLIMDEPTRGVDVGAKSEIYALMSQLASEGMAIIVVSSDLPEIIGVSDRILIYHEGRINGEVFREDILSGKVSQEYILSKEVGNG